MPQAIRPGAYYGKFVQQLQQSLTTQANQAVGGVGAGASPTSVLNSIASAAASPDPAKRTQINGSILAAIDAQLSQTVAGIDTSLANVGITVDPGGGQPVSPIGAASLGNPGGNLNSFTGSLISAPVSGSPQTIMEILMPIINRLKPLVERMMPTPPANNDTNLTPVNPINPVLLPNNNDLAVSIDKFRPITPSNNNDLAVSIDKFKPITPSNDNDLAVSIDKFKPITPSNADNGQSSQFRLKL